MKVGTCRRVVQTVKHKRKTSILNDRIDIGSCLEEYLERLAVTSATICGTVVHRAQRPFFKKSDLLRAHGVGKKTAVQIGPYLRPLPQDAVSTLEMIACPGHLLPFLET